MPALSSPAAPGPAHGARTLRTMVAWSVLLGLAAALLLVRGGPATAQVTELTTAEREEASRLYAQQCASCHGSQGGGAIVPGFDRPAPPLADADGVTVPYVDLVIRTGRMPPPENPFDNRPRRVVFDDHQREILVAWMAEVFDLEGDIPTPPPGDAGRGLEVWTLHCGHCHGATGAGGVAGAGAWTPAVSQYDAVTIAEAIRVGPFEMPRFDQQQISDQEVADVAAFMETVRTEHGTLLLGIVELNPVFASAFVALLALLVLLITVIIAGKPAWFPDPEAEGPKTEDTA